MTPTAVSQVLEQLFKLSTGFVLARLLIKKGVVFGTMGALLGVTLSEVVGCVFIIIYFFIFKKKNKDSFNFSTNYQVTFNILLTPHPDSLFRQCF